MPPSVLIADDSGFMRALLRDVLEGECEVVGEAENGVEAVELYEQRSPDLVMLDIEMPIQGGIETTERLKELDPAANVIACTNEGKEDQIQAASEVGVDGYITKPFQKESVQRAIQEVVSGKG